MGFPMATPTPPYGSDHEEQGTKRTQPRRLPPPYALRVVAAVITVTAIIGLVWQLESHPHRAVVATVALPAISHSTYGDPNVAALRPATSLAVGARRVCTDELRPKAEKQHLALQALVKPLRSMRSACKPPEAATRVRTARRTAVPPRAGSAKRESPSPPWRCTCRTRSRSASATSCVATGSAKRRSRASAGSSFARLSVNPGCAGR